MTQVRHNDEILEFCENAYMNGFADETIGDVESPEGHTYYMHNDQDAEAYGYIGYWSVTTDSLGFKTLCEYADRAEWLADQEATAAAYDKWLDTDPDEV